VSHHPHYRRLCHAEYLRYSRCRSWSGESRTPQHQNRNAGLTQQVSDLRQRQIDLARQMEVASSALQQATKEMKAERAASQKRVSTLNRSIQQLTAQQKSLRYVVKRATKEQASLQSAVESHASKLGEADGLNASPVPTPAEPTNEPAKTALIPPAQTPVPNEPDPKPTVMATAAPVNQPVATRILRRPAFSPPNQSKTTVVLLKNWIASLWQSSSSN